MAIQYAFVSFVGLSYCMFVRIRLPSTKCLIRSLSFVQMMTFSLSNLNNLVISVSLELKYFYLHFPVVFSLSYFLLMIDQTTQNGYFFIYVFILWFIFYAFNNSDYVVWNNRVSSE
jgi:hypothetical protein